ncbi:MAG: hypothetical protein II899_00145 [Bacteroidales bacterium]|nr:hypothetical protein [Bacteroidales bacterium]
MYRHSLSGCLSDNRKCSQQCRQFYRTYPIANTVRSQLNWSQYRRLIQIEDPDKRDHLTLNC